MYWEVRAHCSYLSFKVESFSFPSEFLGPRRPGQLKVLCMSTPSSHLRNPPSNPP